MDIDFSSSAGGSCSVEEYSVTTRARRCIGPRMATWVVTTIATNVRVVCCLVSMCATEAFADTHVSWAIRSRAQMAALSYNWRPRL